MYMDASKRHDDMGASGFLRPDSDIEELRNEALMNINERVETRPVDPPDIAFCPQCGIGLESSAPGAITYLCGTVGYTETAADGAKTRRTAHSATASRTCAAFAHARASRWRLGRAIKTYAEMERLKGNTVTAEQMAKMLIDGWPSPHFVLLHVGARDYEA